MLDGNEVENEVENEDDDFSITEDEEFLQELTEEVWKENFDKVGYIYICVGDEPEGCTSRVYKDNHREFVGLDKNYKIDPGSVQIAAGRKAVKLRESYLASGKSFAMETTLSGVSEISFIKKAIFHGYKVTVYFISVRSATDNAARVASRVLKGGHDVPIPDIVRRRERSLQNLSFLIDNLPSVVVFDNNLKIRNILRKQNNKVIYLARDLPEWFTKNVSSEKLKKYL